MRLNFRDIFAVIIWLTSIAIFLLAGLQYDIPDAIIGQLITIDTLVVQFYFRKRGETTKE